MSDATRLRLYTPDTAEPTPYELAARELLRPCDGRTGERDLEPFSRAWFEEIEHKRYARAGAWLPRVLEFSRHRDESLIMLGPGLGTDALQYLRRDALVTMAVTPQDAQDAIRRNFERRNLVPNLVPITSRANLPFVNGQFDLGYLNLLYAPTEEFPAIVAELYRVLKAGGKLFVLVPAWYDLDRWQRWLLPHRRFYSRVEHAMTGPKLSRRELRKLCEPFDAVAVQKRHLRRSELPPLWRALPLSLLERVAGRVLAVRATKPVRAAVSALAPQAA